MAPLILVNIGSSKILLTMSIEFGSQKYLV